MNGWKLHKSSVAFLCVSCGKKVSTFYISKAEKGEKCEECAEKEMPWLAWGKKEPKPMVTQETLFSD